MSEDSTEKISSQIKVHKFTPSQVVEFAKDRPDLIELVASGFGHDVSKVNPEEMLEDEYSHGDDRTLIFLAEKDNKIVGSLYFILWKNNETDKRGKPLMEFLERNGKDLIDLKKIKKDQVVACDIGVVVHPNHQGEGVVDKLYEEALDTVKPIFFVGQTKTAAAPVSRERSLMKHSYVTFYGGLPIREEDGNSELGKFTADLYYHVRKDRATRVGDKGVHYDPADDVLKPDINVDLNRLPKNVATVFQEIMEADKNRPDGQISFGVLVSVNKDYLK